MVSSTKVRRLFVQTKLNKVQANHSMYPITFFIDTYYGISQVFDIELLKHRGKYFSKNLVVPKLHKKLPSINDCQNQYF